MTVGNGFWAIWFTDDAATVEEGAVNIFAGEPEEAIEKELNPPGKGKPEFPLLIGLTLLLNDKALTDEVNPVNWSN